MTEALEDKLIDLRDRVDLLLIKQKNRRMHVKAKQVRQQSKTKKLQCAEPLDLQQNQSKDREQNLTKQRRIGMKYLGIVVIIGIFFGALEMGGGLVNMHLLYIPTFLSIQILPKEDKAEIRELFGKFKNYLQDNWTADYTFWEHNPYGWRRWEAILNHMDAEDKSHLLPGFQEYVNKLDAIRGVNAKDVFPELAHLL